MGTDSTNICKFVEVNTGIFSTNYLSFKSSILPKLLILNTSVNDGPFFVKALQVHKCFVGSVPSIVRLKRANEGKKTWMLENQRHHAKGWTLTFSDDAVVVHGSRPACGN